MQDGYIFLHRKITENGLWKNQPFSKGQAWIDLLLSASFKDHSFWVREIEVKVKQGQVAMSELTMAKRWDWSRNKVRRFLLYLKTEHQIEQQKSNVTTLITILNWSEYQKPIQQTKQQEDTKRTPNDTQSIKENKENKEKNSLCERDFILDQFKKTFQRPMSNADFQKVPYLMQFDPKKVEKAFTAAKGKKSLNYVISVLENEPVKRPVKQLMD